MPKPITTVTPPIFTLPATHNLSADKLDKQCLPPFAAQTLHKLDAPSDSFAALCGTQPAVGLAFALLHDDLTAEQLNWFEATGFDALLDATAGQDAQRSTAVLNSLIKALQNRKPFESIEHVCDKVLSTANVRSIERSIDHAMPPMPAPSSWKDSFWHALNGLRDSLSRLQYAGTGRGPGIELDHEARARALFSEVKLVHAEPTRFGRILELFYLYSQVVDPASVVKIGEILRESAYKAPEDIFCRGSLLPLAEAFPFQAPVNPADVWQAAAARSVRPALANVVQASEIPKVPEPLFSPSAASINEQRTRQQADQTIERIINRMPESGFMPEDGEGLILGMLAQLNAWPADTQIKVFDSHNDLLEVYLKGNHVDDIHGSVDVVRHSNGEYVARGDRTDGASPREQLFELILRQLPANSELGSGGNFRGSSSRDGRIVTMRQQLADLAQAQRAYLFDVLLADDATFKSNTAEIEPNPLLPFWKRQLPADRTPVLIKLHALNPELPDLRLGLLLEQSPLSDSEASTFIASGTLPEAFIEAKTQSMAEMLMDRAIDGLYNTRTYNAETDAQARQAVGDLLAERLDRRLIIIEPGEPAYEATSLADTSVVLWHFGGGRYEAQDLHNGGTISVDPGTDSFYLAVGSVLQPHERKVLSMQADTDVSDLRRTVGDVVAQAYGGWFDPDARPQISTQVTLSDALPDWLQEASIDDMRSWEAAVQAYQRALLESQTPEILDPGQYADPKALRGYVNKQLAQRIRTDLGLVVDPDHVFVTTTASVQIGLLDSPLDIDLPLSPRPDEVVFELVPRTRSLVEFALENIGPEDTDYWLTARFSDADGKNILTLKKSYIYGLVRDENVGESYAKFLEHRLLNSIAGEWDRDAYAQVMETQMHLDALEAKLAGDFADNGNLPSELADRGYQWVEAVLNHPADDKSRTTVEGHRIQAQRLRINGVELHGVLVIAPESKQAVNSRVVYTPDAPGGLRFREFASMIDMKSRLLANPDLSDYLIGRCSPDYQADMRRALISDQSTLVASTEVVTVNLYHASYEAGVRHAIASIDEQSTSTSEANWNTAWSVAATLGDVVIEFAPVKVQFPVAAGRSLYALWRGIGALNDPQGCNAAAHFVRAGTLLAFGISPGSGKAKAPAPRGASTFSASLALKQPPSKPILRVDGIYKGVYETPSAVGNSRYYASEDRKFYEVGYNRGLGTWEVIDHRNPQAFYKTRVRNEEGRWVRNILLRGGFRPDDELIEMSGRNAVLKQLSPQGLVAYLEYMQAHRRPGEIKKIIDTLTSKGGAELSRAYKQLHTIAMEKAVAASSVAGPSGSVQKRPHPGSPEKAGGPTQAKLPKSPAKMGLSYPPVTEVSIRREDWPKYMYHYTTDTNLAAFRGDPLMNASTKDAYGNELKNPKGVYVTDLAPNSMDPQKLAETLFGKNQYNVGSRAVKVSSYMEFDMSKVRNADVKLVRLQSDKLPCNIYRVETGNINGVWRVRKSLMTHDGDNILVGSGKTSDWYPKQRKT